MFFFPDGDGNYDITNNAVVATPGPQNYRSQNASLQQSWEMNYQEAAIYLQVLKLDLEWAKESLNHFKKSSYKWIFYLPDVFF